MAQARDVVVGEVAAAAAHQPGVLTPLDACADHRALPRLPATSSTAATIPEYPVQRHRLPGERGAHLGSRSGWGVASSSAIALSTIAGVQKPHCNAWCVRNASIIGCRASGLPKPSIVVIARSSHCTANSRHERTGSPSTSTVHAPHGALLAARVRAREPELLAQHVEQRVARLDAHLGRLAVHVELHGALHAATSCVLEIGRTHAARRARPSSPASSARSVVRRRRCARTRARDVAQQPVVGCDARRPRPPSASEQSSGTEPTPIAAPPRPRRSRLGRRVR